jgi:hypothetical protein
MLRSQPEAIEVIEIYLSSNPVKNNFLRFAYACLSPFHLMFALSIQPRTRRRHLLLSTQPILMQPLLGLVAFFLDIKSLF